MKKVKRTYSYDPDDHNVIFAAGESNQTDCAEFIEQQKQLLLEYTSVPTDGGITRKSNDERTDGGSKMNFSDDHYRSTFSTGDLKNPPTLTGQPGLSNVGGRSYFGFVYIEKEDYDKIIQRHEKGRSDTIMGFFGVGKFGKVSSWVPRFKHSFVILLSPLLRGPGKLKSFGCLA